MRLSERRRARSTRGHVRVDETARFPRWLGGAIAGVILLVAAALLVVEVVIPALGSRRQAIRNSRTWFEFDPWAVFPDGVESAGQIAARLRDNGIGTVYIEGTAWLSDGSLRVGEHAMAFAQGLREAYPELRVLLWLRMSNEQIADETLRERALDAARTAVFDWQYDGVQLNAYAVTNRSQGYVQLVRALRDAIGPDALLSLTVPPDRIPTDPDVPIGLTVEPEMTWDAGFKLQVGLQKVDELVIMAHAAGLQDEAAYSSWVAYQLESYAEALEPNASGPRLAVAVPTYDAAPGHDPEVESVRASIEGVERGRERLGQDSTFDGIGLYIYSATDSREWAIYRDVWLGLD